MLVLANGCFDPLHYGHLLHLRAARELGTRLVVALSSDAEIIRCKGERRLFSGQRERAQMLMMLRCVDRVIVFDGLMEALEGMRPDILVKGSDYKELEPRHAKFCRENGIKVAFTDTPKWSVLSIADELRSR